MDKEIINIIYGKSLEGKNFLKDLRKREEQVHKDVEIQVDKILDDIKFKGDEALIKYTNKFDSKIINKNNLRVKDEEIKEAYEKIDKEFLKILKEAYENIIFFHEKQKRNSWMETKEKSIILGQKIMPLNIVGIYVPGGTAAYPSSVLMNALPAKVSGVKEIIMVTPPRENGSIDPAILVAADISGVSKIYKIGGAQAIGALAFGTENIDKVDKIVGPGNIYVALAKKRVYGNVDIDMIAGPSEILVLADETAKAEYIAADLMSQGEHEIGRAHV